VEIFNHPLAFTTLAHVFIVLALGARVVMRRLAPGIALAWMFLIVMLPFAGPLVYLLIGERRIGAERAHRIDSLLRSLGEDHGKLEIRHLTDVDWSRHPPFSAGLNRLGSRVAGCSALRGSDIELHSNAETVLKAIARDIDDAKTGVSMTFYIWNEGGCADDVFQALIGAAERGVTCRVLVDALGARPWLHGRQPERLRAAGVHVRTALPVGLLRTLVGRTDLRLHRKIVVVDDTVAWTGSMNLVDPRMFKQGAGVGKWVDAMVRLQGPVVAPLGATALGDWMLETGTPLDDLAKTAGLNHVTARGDADIQVVPSGPGESGDALLQMLLTLINSAREELVLTTPYLVPDASVLWALRGAAGRGVAVSIIVPERVDSILTRYASRSFFDDLLDVGVDIFLYRKGLLHTKSVVADAAVSMFGTVNLDMRSLWLNYENTLFVYDTEFAKALRALQQCYILDSRRVEPSQWMRRPLAERFIENSFRLMSPLL
jgi:cardiolipin synthase